MLSKLVWFILDGYVKINISIFLLSGVLFILSTWSELMGRFQVCETRLFDTIYEIESKQIETIEQAENLFNSMTNIEREENKIGAYIGYVHSTMLRKID